ncbi:MAG: cupin domain-containing protein [Candidatus Thermoplasmatota archaeon]|nr:cupin domain-containing protein [Candidatus Thermoplasmatota archaeon]
MLQKSVVKNLITLADYQNGSIVSKTLIDKNAGTITFFAFDKNQGLSEHTAPYDAFLQIIEGQAEIRISGKSFILQKNDLIVMPANEPHAVKALEKFKMLLCMIKS